LDTEGGSQKATLVVVVVVVVVVVSSLKNTPTLSSYAAERSATKLCMHIRADIPYISTVSDFPLIFQLMRNCLIKCPRHYAVYCRRSVCSAACTTAVQPISHSELRRIVMNIHAQAGLIVGIIIV